MLLHPRRFLIPAALLLCALACQAQRPTPATSERAQTPASSISGTLTHDGRPLAGAEVCARLHGPLLDRTRADVDTPPCTQTDASGHYTLPLEAGAYFIIASAREHLPARQPVTLHADAPPPRADFALERGGREFAGVLVDLAGQPIANAKLFATATFPPRSFPAGQAMTAADGRFSLWSQPGANIGAHAPGYARKLVIHQQSEHPYTLIPESRIRGRVVDSKGAGVSGARVALSSRFGPAYGFPHDAVLSGPDGSFELDGLAPDRYELLAVSDEAAGHSEKLYVDFAETLDEVLITLERPVEPMSIHVVPREGKLPGPCYVQITSGRGSSSMWFKSGEDGHITLPVPAGEDAILLSVGGLRCPGMIGAPPYPPLEAGPDAKPNRLEVQPGRELHLRLRTASGAPLAGARVEVDVPTPELSDARPAVPKLDWKFINNTEVETDAQGRATLDGLAPGTYELHVFEWFDSDTPTFVEVGEAQVTELEHRMSPSARLEVQSSPAQAYRWVNVEQCRPRERSSPWRSMELLDASGRAVFEHVPPGPLRVDIAGSPSCETGRGTAVELEAGATAKVELDAAPPREWSVITVDEAGRPLAGVVLEVQMLGGLPDTAELGWRFAFDEHFAVTGPEGRAVLRLLRSDPSTTIIGASADLFGRGTIAQDADELTITMRPRGPKP